MHIADVIGTCGLFALKRGDQYRPLQSFGPTVPITEHWQQQSKSESPYTHGRHDSEIYMNRDDHAMMVMAWTVSVI